ncbi:MAG: class I SAM-dependent methyltransferase [Chloroflexi bacterium]|nr:class I SAM-dependent methyltransferase [Chloroflexota bacterium]
MTETPDALLWRHLQTLPAFRALLRAAEATFYQRVALPRPVLDVGCGDGHFAAHTFAEPLDVGLDPWWEPLREARVWRGHRLVLAADGAAMPFAAQSFGSAISNSVLEHIPHVDAVLAEVHRVLRPRAPFLVTVPNHRFTRNLSGARLLERIGWTRAADAYRRAFNRISRHVRTDPPEVWQARFERAGFRVRARRDYFSPTALALLEWGHAYGLPSWLVKRVTGRWMVSPARWNVAWLHRALRRFVRQPEHPQGAYTFFYLERR